MLAILIAVLPVLVIVVGLGPPALPTVTLFQEREEGDTVTCAEAAIDPSKTTAPNSSVALIGRNDSTEGK